MSTSAWLRLKQGRIPVKVCFSEQVLPILEESRKRYVVLNVLLYSQTQNIAAWNFGRFQRERVWRLFLIKGK